MCGLGSGPKHTWVAQYACKQKLGVGVRVGLGDERQGVGINKLRMGGSDSRGRRGREGWVQKGMGGLRGGVWGGHARLL